MLERGVLAYTPSTFSARFPGRWFVWIKTKHDSGITVENLLFSDSFEGIFTKGSKISGRKFRNFPRRKFFCRQGKKNSWVKCPPIKNLLELKSALSANRCAYFAYARACSACARTYCAYAQPYVPRVRTGCAYAKHARAYVQYAVRTHSTHAQYARAYAPATHAMHNVY